MRLYIAYASEDVTTAEQIHLALLSDRHDVFFDRGSLRPGDDFDRRFRDAINAADMMIFLVSPSSVRQGCYALTELDYARRRWPHPQNRLLPVVVEPIDLSTLPAYLKAVTILEPRGSVAAEVAQAVRSRKESAPDSRATSSLSLSALTSSAVGSALLAITLGTLFSRLYPRVEVDLPVAMLFLIVAVSIVFGVRALWRVLRS
jgi:TIR domain